MIITVDMHIEAAAKKDTGSFSFSTKVKGMANRIEKQLLAIEGVTVFSDEKPPSFFVTGKYPKAERATVKKILASMHHDYKLDGKQIKDVKENG